MKKYLIVLSTLAFCSPLFAQTIDSRLTELQRDEKNLKSHHAILIQSTKNTENRLWAVAGAIQELKNLKKLEAEAKSKEESTAEKKESKEPEEDPMTKIEEECQEDSCETKDAVTQE